LEAELIATAIHWIGVLGCQPAAGEWEDAIRTVADRILFYQAAWQAHPDYTDCQRLCPRPPWNPILVGVWRHAPGVQGRTESYYIGGFDDITCPATRRWTARTWKGGQFTDMRPIKPEWPVHPFRQGFISNLRHPAYAGRMELKRLLPKHLHKWVNRARSVESNFHPDHCPEIWGVALRAGRRRERYTRTKGEAFVADILPDDVRADLAQYVDPLIFYRAATGRMPVNEIAGHVAHQLELFPTKEG